VVSVFGSPAVRLQNPAVARAENRRFLQSEMRKRRRAFAGRISVEWSLRYGFLGVSGGDAPTLAGDMWWLNVITWFRIRPIWFVGGRV
jgi:hypothetical protein